MGYTAAVIGGEQIGGQTHAAEAAALNQLYAAPAYGEVPLPIPAGHDAVFTAGAGTTEELSKEEYGNSGRLQRAVGTLLVRQEVALDRPEDDAHMESGVDVDAFVERARQEFLSNVTEKLKTHPKYRRVLDSDDEHVYRRVNGRIMTADGVTPIADLIGNGAKTSEAKAKKDPRMIPQARRDAIDYKNIQTVENELEVGEAVAYLTVDPKDEFKIDKNFYRNLGVIGYREGLVYAQWFMRVSEDEYVFGTYSIEDSELDIWRAVLADKGVVVPEGEPTSSWHQYGLKRTGSLEDMRAEIVGMRAEFYERRGLTHKRYSVTEFVKKHEPLLNRDFDMLIRPLMCSSATGRKHPVIHAYAEALLANPGDLSDEAIGGLTRILHSDDFDEASRAMVEECITYGAFMDLEEELELFVSGKEHAPAQLVPAAHFSPENAGGVAQRLNQLAHSLHRGVSNGIEPGGCVGGKFLGKDRAEGKIKKTEEPDAVTDVGREKAVEDAEEGEGSKTICCPMCGLESNKEDVEHNTGPDEGYLECPGCGFWADVCTGEKGFRGSEAEDAARETLAAEILALLGSATTASVFEAHGGAFDKHNRHTLN